MKKIVITILTLFILTNIFAVNITVKNIKFNIIFNELPKLKTTIYNFNSLEYNKTKYDKVVSTLYLELSKYPKIILSNYIAKQIFIVDDCYNTKTLQHINGLSNKNILVFRYKVFNIKYYTIVLHHEIFHSIIGNTNKNIVNNLLKTKLDDICNYNNLTNEYDYTRFKSNFITEYHPDFEETSCEMFSTLMYNNKNYINDISIPYWLINYNDNYKLKEKFKIVINFTSYITNTIMDLNFYYNINN